jgi:flagellar basal-body rod protein FlgC
MNLFQSMAISASGLNAQRTVTNVISMNLANIQTTWTEEGGPYIRRQAALSPSPLSPGFPNILANVMEGEPMGVKVEIQKDETRDPETIFDPSHPHADENGYVNLPNINVLEEMVALLGAVRSYEANVTAFNAAKSMALKALEIGSR